jgi:hypothetical protein
MGSRGRAPLRSFRSFKPISLKPAGCDRWACYGVPKDVARRSCRSILFGMAAPAVQAKVPIVIHRSVNRDGETFALEPGSLERLRQEFGLAIHPRPRVFIAHESKADYEHVHGDIAGQVIQILTGMAEERLSAIGGVSFRDPVTEQELPRAP